MPDSKNKCSESTTQNPLVSVIVPIYKVEKYLKRSLNSILRQTYKNLQIILVDDGSPDNCGSICDEYEKIDERISVIHQNNQGVAAARNTGLKSVRGEWITWVDPDDWVEPEFISDMLSEALSHNADIVICGHYEEHKNRTKYCGVSKYDVLNSEQAIRLLIEDDEIRNYLWDKLWRAELFRGECFPVGRTYEDIAVCYKLFFKAEYIVCIPKANYHYTIRKGSIVNDPKISNLLNWEISNRECGNFLKAHFPEYDEKKELDRIRMAISIWGNTYSNGILFTKGIKDKLEPISMYFRTHSLDRELLSKVGLAGRLIIKLVPYNTAWSYCISGVIGTLYRIKHRGSL